MKPSFFAKKIRSLIIFLVIIVFISLSDAMAALWPAPLQIFPWSWSPVSPFPVTNQFPLPGWPLNNYLPRTGQFASSGWPFYTPPPSQPVYFQRLPWSWDAPYPFPGTGRISIANWPQSTYYPMIWPPFQSSNWPVYSPPPAGLVNEITLIHIGDIHGHLIPRAHLTSDGDGRMRGGLARMYTRIEEIRSRRPNNLLVNCGDTIQGSAEALYTEGSAIINVLRSFNIDAFAPGNWDYLYGTKRFRELFGQTNPIAPWNALAANLYYNGEPYATAIGQRVLPPYKIKYMNGLKIGILGFTAERGPMVVYADVIKGFGFTRGESEVAEFVPFLREVEKVDLLVMISELGLANNIRLAEENPGIDVILSSDMHEITWEPVITSTGTIIVEEGTDGTLVGELTLAVENGRATLRSWHQHVVDSRLRDHWEIATRVEQVRSSFVSGSSFRPHVNPISGTLLKIPIDTVIGEAAIGLYRANYSQEPMPGVVEGSSHDFLTDTFRFMGQADVGSIRGFRYGTHIAPGPIRLEDIYHFIPIGPFIAKGEVTGQQIKLLIENNADGSLNPDVSQWRGGWLYGWSGLRYDLDPYAPAGQRAQNIMVNRWGTNLWEPLTLGAIYTHASYNFAREPYLINKIPAENIQVLLDATGNPLDATEVVAEYLKTHIANPELNRIRILQPLPPTRYRNPEVQPLWGCSP